MLKPSTVWIMTNCGKLLEKWEYQTILPVSWETCMQVKTQQLEPCMEQLISSRWRKDYNRAVCCHRLFNLYAEHILRNARLDELQAGIKIGRRNINNLKYADATTLIAENEKELKSLLMKVKEEREKACLKCHIQKTKIMAPGPITHSK